MEEIWKDVIGYEGLYTVSNIGRIKSLPRPVKRRSGNFILSKERILTPIINSIDGYYRVSLFRSCKQNTFLLHRLIALSFLPNQYSKKCVNHLNGDKSDNKVCNLEWVTHSENMIHAIRTGLTPAPPRNDSRKKVCQIDIKTGGIINIWPSISEANVSLSGNTTGLIGRVCNIETRTAYGFKWRHYEV